MAKLISLLIASLMLLTAVGCNDNPAVPDLDYESEVVVFGLLMITDMNIQQKTIQLERSYKVTDRLPSYAGGRAIQDAEVIVAGDSARVVFKHLFNGVYSDANDELWLEPGASYSLTVRLANGREITSQCTMPGKPNILSPSRMKPAPAFQPLQVTWEEAPFAFRYQIAVHDDFHDFQFSAFSASDEEELYPFLFAGPGNFNLKIAALDQNYFDYLRSRSNREQISHINGALGVFGAMAFDREHFIAFVQ